MTSIEKNENIEHIEHDENNENNEKSTPTTEPEEPEAPVTILIKDIVRDERFQIRKKLDDGTIKRYMSVYNSGRKMPPVKVAKIRLGLVLVDGWHRVAALERLSIATVSVEIIEATVEKARFMAAMANIGHGLPLKQSEVREVFKAYVRAGEYLNKDDNWLGPELKSYRQIEKELGGLKSYATIRNWMKKDFPKIARQYGADETRKGKGGLPENVRIDPFKSAIVRALFDEALASLRCLDDTVTRSEIIRYVEGNIEGIRKEKPIEPVETFDDF